MRKFSTFMYQGFFTFRSWSDPQLHPTPGTPEPSDLLVIQDHHPATEQFEACYFFPELLLCHSVFRLTCYFRFFTEEKLHHVVPPSQRNSTTVTVKCRCMPLRPKSMSRQEIKTHKTPSKFQLISLYSVLNTFWTD